MPKLRVHNFTTSLDGFSAGPDQSLENPMGVGTELLHAWVFKTAFGMDMIGQTGGEKGIDNDYLEAGVENIGAHILGRNMFGPVRGDWPNDEWKGWWGPNPPYHHQVFVLTHFPRASFEMEGGTVFHFVTDGIESALKQAFEAAGGKDVRVGGGAATVRAYMQAGLVDEIHIPVVPILLGRGERLFEGIDVAALGYEVVSHEATSEVMHYRLAKK